MENLKIEIFKAKWGESFLVTLSREDRPIHVLIDMGFSHSYDNIIKKKILEIANVGIIDYLIFTHIDKDHIGGGIKFLKENNREKLIPIGDIWYNGYRHLQNNNKSQEKLSEEEIIKLKSITNNGMVITEERILEPISGRQGSILGALILEGGYNWNKCFSNNAVSTDVKNVSTEYDDIKITILSPDVENLNKLEDEWRKELNRIGIWKEANDEIFDDAFEVLMSKKSQKIFIPKSKQINFMQEDLFSYVNSEDFVDTDPINGSSISFVIEFKEKKVLFLADAHCHTIIKNLREKYNIQEGKRIFFDAIKISHHGSCGNTNIELLNIIDSDKFIISTNGYMFNHPDIQTIAQIVCRPTERERVLYFNYDNVAKRFKRQDWMQKYKYTISQINGDIISFCL